MLSSEHPRTQGIETQHCHSRMLPACSQSCYWAAPRARGTVFWAGCMRRSCLPFFCSRGCTGLGTTGICSCFPVKLDSHHVLQMLYTSMQICVYPNGHCMMQRNACLTDGAWLCIYAQEAMLMSDELQDSVSSAQSDVANQAVSCTFMDAMWA